MKKKFNPPATLPIFIIVVALLIVFNSTASYKEIRLLRQIRRQVPYIFMGNKFLGLKAILKDAKSIGYYTDKNLDDNKPALQFAQAQYTLAPIILDLNNTNHSFVLFDCSSEEIALQKIKEAGLVPMKKNQFGIILAGHGPKDNSQRPKLRVPFWMKPSQ